MRRIVLTLLILMAFAVPLREAAAASPRGNAIAEVLGLVVDNYAHPERIHLPELLEAALAYTAERIPSFRFALDADGRTLRLGVGERRKDYALPPPGAREGLRRILEEMAVFTEEALRDDPPERSPAHLLLTGLLSALDPHATLLDASTFHRFQLRAQGRSGDVGVSLARRDGRWTVEELIEGSPGQRAGLRQGDRVLQIETRATIFLDTEEAESLMLGMPGSELNMLVIQDGGHPVPLTLRRTPTPQSSVDSHALSQGSQGQLAYMRVTSFQEGTEEELWEHLGRLQASDVPLVGFILDLRGNPGGVVDQAIRTADLFLGRGEIATLSQAGRPQERIEARWYRGLPRQPMVVLIDHDTASAGELVAGALQANGRALVIGERSYGKAAVQSVFPLSKGGALKLTVATFRTRVGPSGEGEGLMPHLRLRSVARTGHGEKPGAWRGLVPGHVVEGAPLAALGFPVLAELPFPGKGFESRGGDSAHRRAEEQTRHARRLEADYAVGLARRLLAANHPADQQALLRQAVMSQGEERVRLDHALVDRLAADGVDWSPSKGLMAGEAEFGPVAVVVRSGTRGPWRPVRQGVAAGDTLRLVMAVRNKGTLPLHRIAVQLESPLDILNGVELPLGRLDGGVVAQLRIERTLPSRLPEGQESIVLALRDAEGRTYDRVHLRLPLRSPDPDRLRLTVSWPKPEGDTAFRDFPERVLKLKLDGRGSSDLRAAAWLSPAAQGVKLDGAARSLPPVPLREGHQEELHFQVHGGRPGRTAPLWFHFLAEGPGAARVQWRTTMARLSPGGRLVLQAPLIRWGNEPSVDVGGRLFLYGTAHDEQGLRDVMVFLNDRKTLYLPANREKDRPLAFRLEAQALPGRNLVRVLARDLDGLVAERVYVVWHDSEAPVPIVRLGDSTASPADR